MESMDFRIDENRIVSYSEDGKLLAELTFPARDAKRVNVDHVFVAESLRGQGIASRLMELVCDHCVRNGLLIVAKCPYAIEWFKKHPERQDVVINVKTRKDL
jgi:predicted GNAT family acetyltransferase